MLWCGNVIYFELGQRSTTLNQGKAFQVAIGSVVFVVSDWEPFLSSYRAGAGRGGAGVAMVVPPHPVRLVTQRSARLIVRRTAA